MLRFIDRKWLRFLLVVSLSALHILPSLPARHHQIAWYLRSPARQTCMQLQAPKGATDVAVFTISGSERLRFGFSP